jgi:cell division protein FtsB
MARGFKTGGRSKALAVSPQLCAGVLARPVTAEQWLGNAREVSRLVAQGFTVKAIAEALAVSDSLVSIWNKAGRSWPDEIRTLVLKDPEKFSPALLTKLGKQLWTDTDPRSRSAVMDRRRNGIPKQSLLSTVQLIHEGKTPRRERRSLIEKAEKLETLANRERAKAHRMAEEVAQLKSENKALEGQISLHRVDDMLREIKRLKMELAKIRSGAKAKSEKTPDEMYLEDELRSMFHAKVDVDSRGFGVYFNGGNRDGFESLLDSLRSRRK